MVFKCFCQTKLWLPQNYHTLPDQQQRPGLTDMSEIWDAVNKMTACSKWNNQTNGRSYPTYTAKMLSTVRHKQQNHIYYDGRTDAVNTNTCPCLTHICVTLIYMRCTYIKHIHVHMN